MHYICNGLLSLLPLWFSVVSELDMADKFKIRIGLQEVFGIGIFPPYAACRKMQSLDLAIFGSVKNYVVKGPVYMETGTTSGLYQYLFHDFF